MNHNPSHKPSFKKGYTFSFTDGDRIIEARCSAMSGMEVIFVNDEEVSRDRSLSLSTTHRFQSGGDDYEMVLNVTSMMAGQVQCWLLRDGELIGRDEQTFYKLSGGRFMSAIGKYFVIGAISGFLAVMALKALT